MHRFTILASAALTFVPLALAARDASAGGGPMNVLVVYSADDASATGVAQHYGAARSLPQGHLCGLTGVKATMTTIDVPTFKTLIQAPVDACIAALPQPDEVDYLVLVRGLPYSVTLPAGAASLEAMLQVGHTTVTATSMELAGLGQAGMMGEATVPNPTFPQTAYFNPADSPVMNQYSAWYAMGDTIIAQAKQRASFHRASATSAGGYHFAGNLFIVQSLDGFDYTDATALVDRAVASDGTFPKAELLCMAAEDSARGARDPECELTTRMLTNAGLTGTYVTAFDPNLASHTVAGYLTGSASGLRTAIAGNTFVPGAIADNLTSFGAAISNFACSMGGTVCPGSENQVSIARFIRAGATGAHGTVNEPLNNTFPNAGTYLHYTFGYSMGESFLFNQRYLYWQNIHLGDPLATPYATRPTVTIQGPGTHPVNEPLVVDATHADGIARIDLYESGKRVGTAMGATLSYSLTEATGQVLDLLAVAVANNAPATRPGWPQPMQEPAPDVQGWTTAMITVGAAASPGTGGAGSGGSPATGAGGSGGATSSPTPAPASGCHCRAGAADARGAWALVFAAAAALRRRRSKWTLTCTVASPVLAEACGAETGRGAKGPDEASASHEDPPQI
jgi:uncharacterized protein (TIGR03790 family)